MGFFDRFYYGKAGKADYTVEDMPANRFALFFQVLRVRFFSLIRVNLIQLLFWIPFILWTIMNFMVLNNLAAEVVDNGMEIATFNEQLLSTLMMYLLGLIPCILITGPSSAGSAYVTRNWARDQHSFIWSDFKDAMKENWKQALAVSAITSVMPFLVFFLYRFYSEMSAQYPVLVVAQVLVAMLGLLYSLAVMIIYPLMVNYQLTFRQLWRNTLLLTVGRLPQMLGIRLLTLVPLAIGVVLTFMGTSFGILFLLLYYILLGFALHRLIYASFANGVFEKFINPKIDGAPVGMGLRPDEDEDDEEEETDGE